MQLLIRICFTLYFFNQCLDSISWWNDLSDHLVRLNPAPLLQSAATFDSADPPPSNQQPVDRIKSLRFLFTFIKINIATLNTHLLLKSQSIFSLTKHINGNRGPILIQ